jgi:glycosyltransferase involved in cell wall biosynthesis
LLTANRIVHGLWIGPLSRLELLTLHSFVAQGHEFHLWRYKHTPDPLPGGVVVRDANEILAHGMVFRKRAADSAVGLGAGSYATFSDLFRTILLYKLGGIWVDMDVLCLRPFDFEQPYVFRSHPLGMVMNLIKCPPGSRLMGELTNEMSARIGEDSAWFDFTLAFIEGIRRQNLQNFVRDDLMPPDSWESLQPFIEADADFNPSWFGLHMCNELWTTLRKTGGLYKGNRFTARLPDRNHPIPGTRIFRLYQQHGLLRPGFEPAEAPVVPGNSLAAEQPAAPSFSNGLHFNAALPSMSLGGAERLVHDLVSGLQGTAVTSKLFVLHDVQPCYPTAGIRDCQVVHLEGQPARMGRIAAEVLASHTPTVFTHLLPVREIEALGRAGVRVVPVIHNSQSAWLDPPQAFEKPWIPFVVAVSQSVKDQMLAMECRTPIVVVRHELQRPPPTPEKAEAERLTIRRRHGIPDDVLLIGMVGQFKAQKAYTRAVRVLSKVQEHVPARLMILGGWDHEWTSGRAAYTATCRQALELGVMADVITPGPIQPTEAYYSAFDVFLNTSAYEGLSIAMLEAMGRGCPVVSADAGGNAEALGATDRLIEDSSNIDAYMQAILEVSERPQRALRPLAADLDLVPRLWSLLGRYGAPGTGVRSPSVPTTLVLTENLNIGGPQRSLANLLRHWPQERPVAVAVLDPAYCQDFLRQIEDSGVLVFGLQGQPSTMEQCGRVLQIIEQMGATTLAFWNVPAPLKLALTKVLEVRPLRLVDVSPGPMLRKELMSAGNYPHRLSLSVSEYFARVDCFVSKYADGLPPETASAHPGRIRIIPNGVPLPASGEAAPLPAGCAPQLVIGTCCRIVPSKRLEQLVDVMDVLAERLPGATLTIVGAADPWHAEYAAHIADKIARAGLRNIHFAGSHADVWPFLRSFRVFVMLSDDQGCPNASLEAMAAGLPVVANDSGGTAEQVIHGVNGFLVSPDDPQEIASAIQALLLDPRMRDSFGAAARRHVERSFPMERMIAEYLDAFGYENVDPFGYENVNANRAGGEDGRTAANGQLRNRNAYQDQLS